MDRELAFFEDGEGNTIHVDIIERFKHKGKEYAVLADLDSITDKDVEDDTPTQVFVMESYLEEDQEVLSPIEDKELLSEVSELVYSRIMELAEEAE